MDFVSSEFYLEIDVGCYSLLTMGQENLVSSPSSFFERGVSSVRR